MRKLSLKMTLSLILVFIVSCEEPETVVTDIVHSDGSVTRKIEMKSTKNNFKISSLQVPLDVSWSIKDSISINEKGDTTWFKKAEKLFKSVEEINIAYKLDLGANKESSRHAEFKKSFKWFNTEYRFSEVIDKKIPIGYPVSDFLNKDELLFFYSPDNLKEQMKEGADSLKYRTLNDSVSHKTDTWTFRNLASAWISEFSRLIQGKPGSNLKAEALKSRENEFVALVEANEKDLDSLWTNGIIMQRFIGDENAKKYKSEADSAGKIVTDSYFADFKEYSVKIIMPGKLIRTNGFADSSKILMWPVKSEFFLTEQYEMWAVSKETNTVAWIVSGLFLAFVLTGVIIKIIKKG